MSKFWFLPLVAITVLFIGCASEEEVDPNGGEFTDTEVAEIIPEPQGIDPNAVFTGSNDHDFTEEEKTNFTGTTFANTGSLSITPEKIVITLREGAEVIELDYVEPTHYKSDLAYICPDPSGDPEKPAYHIIISNARCVNPVTNVVYDKKFIVHLNPYPIEGCGGNVVVEKSQDTPPTPTEGGESGEPMSVEIK